MVRVIVECRAKAGKGDELQEAILQLRAEAMGEPGFISGESLRGYDDPSIVLVISTWASAETWRRWEQSIGRSNIGAHISTLLEEEPKTRIWAITCKREQADPSVP